LHRGLGRILRRQREPSQKASPHSQMFDRVVRPMDKIETIVQGFSMTRFLCLAMHSLPIIISSIVLSQNPNGDVRLTIEPKEAYVEIHGT
jgi:hypothetical protein